MPDVAAGPLIETDAVVIGAGPVGLFQVFELGLLEIGAHVVDSLPQPGGQCTLLYPDKPIYDIPALAVCTGRDLVDRLLAQIQPFGAGFHLGQEVSVVANQADGRFRVETSHGTRLLARAVIVAGGAGSFQPRRLSVDGLDAYRDTQLFYRVEQPEALAGKRLVVVGDGDDALDWALHFAQPGPQRAAQVLLVHRRDMFRAAPATVERMRALCAAGQMQFIAAQVSGIHESNGRLSALALTGADGAPHNVPLDALLVLQGLSPRLGPIAGWGLALERRHVVVDTEKFETSTPGIFAVGDVCSYAGKQKLILCGFHEATLAAFGVARRLRPDQRVPLEYTTTSSRLHRVLGVAPRGGDGSGS